MRAGAHGTPDRNALRLWLEQMSWSPDPGTTPEGQATPRWKEHHVPKYFSVYRSCSAWEPALYWASPNLSCHMCVNVCEWHCQVALWRWRGVLRTVLLIQAQYPHQVMAMVEGEDHCFPIPQRKTWRHRTEAPVQGQSRRWRNW